MILSSDWPVVSVACGGLVMLTSKVNKSPVMMDIAEGNFIRPYVRAGQETSNHLLTSGFIVRVLQITITSELHFFFYLSNSI